MIGVLTLLLFLSVLGHISVLGQASSKFKPVSQELILSLPQLNALSSTLGLKFGGLNLTGHKSLFVYNSNTGSTNIFYPVKKKKIIAGDMNIDLQRDYYKINIGIEGIK